ncbi:MAG: hypothetical protein EOP34_04035 [Rickettsiales bacterium]|nr:MAG: hypothetical protein EOP34_04035 [Rickettsiales bacterium]
MRDINTDMGGILDRLRGISDQYVVKTLSDMDASIDLAQRTRALIPELNDGPTYSFKYFDFHITHLKVGYLGFLAQYMSLDEIQAVKVAQDTFVIMKADLTKFYMLKVEASQILTNLNHSKLMMEVKWLLLDKPFDP